MTILFVSKPFIRCKILNNNSFQIKLENLQNRQVYELYKISSKICPNVKSWPQDLTDAVFSGNDFNPLSLISKVNPLI